MNRLWLAKGHPEGWQVADDADHAIELLAARAPDKLALDPAAGFSGVLHWCLKQRYWPLNEIRLVSYDSHSEVAHLVPIQSLNFGGRFRADPEDPERFQRIHVSTDPVDLPRLAARPCHLLLDEPPLGLASDRILERELGDVERVGTAVVLRGYRDLDAVRVARRLAHRRVIRVDDAGPTALPCEIIELKDDGSVVLDLAVLAPTMERYSDAKRAWSSLRRGQDPAASDALSAAVEGMNAERLFELAGSQLEVALRVPPMWSLPRDPARIERTLALIGELWRRAPDQRLGQLLSNVLHTRGSLSGVEDTRLEEALVAEVKNLGHER